MFEVEVCLEEGRSGRIVNDTQVQLRGSCADRKTGGSDDGW